MPADPSSRAFAACVAAHRLGWGEARLQPLMDDPQGWALAQMQAMPGAASASTSDGPITPLLKTVLSTRPETAEADRNAARRELRAHTLAGHTRRWQTWASSERPVRERWQRFWANHFCVSGTRAVVAPLVPSHDREAIAPHLDGHFLQMLRAATLHPAMLLYLDNASSIGPDSRAGRRRARGLNENLARELLELHTLGVQAGYTQDDVTQTARLLTGWTVRRDDDPPTSTFDPARHEPGTKRILGQSLPEGPEALDTLLTTLARHPATARHLSRKIARHFVTDDPPQALVDALVRAWQDSDGHLPTVAEALLRHPLTWTAHPPKIKTPEELIVSAHRVLQVPLEAPTRMASALTDLGQPPGRAPSPQGWPDRAEDWLGPDSLMHRVRWAHGLAHRLGSAVTARLDVRERAQDSLGPWLHDTTRDELRRADSPQQTLALWLASPEFQQRG